MNNLRAIRNRLGLTQAQVAKALDIDRTTYTKYELGQAQPDSQKLLRMAELFNTSVDHLLGKNHSSRSDLIPILGDVPAGVPFEAIEDIEGYIDLSTATFTPTAEIFALRIKGRSMEPDIYDKSIVLVSRQDTIESGEIAVIRVNGDEATIKRVKRLPDGLMLIPINPEYDPVFYNAHQVAELPVTIIGKVIEVRRRI